MRARHRRTQTSSRPSIVAWIAAVTATGLMLLILAVSVVLRATVSSDIQESVAQEAGEIRRFSAAGIDPTTGRPFTSTARFVELYLARQQPEPAELLVGGRHGSDRPLEQRGESTPAFGDLDPDAQRRILDPHSAGTLSTARHGTVTWHTVEIRASDGLGYLAVAAFHQPRESEIRQQLGVLALLALGSLLATGAVAWVASGRILRHTAQFEEAVDAATEDGVPRLPEEGGAEYVRLARAANRLTARAEAAAEQEREFSEDLAHEVRTPIAILRGSLEQPGTTLDQRELTRVRALQEVRRLQEVVGNLVVLNRAGHPEGPGTYPEVDLEVVLGDVVAGWQDRLADLTDQVPPPDLASQVPPAHLSTDGHDAVRVALGETVEDILVAVDEARLTRILDELIANAVDACPPGAVVHVGSTTDVADGHPDVSIEVEDCGRGIPPEERESVLGRFAQASNDPDPGAGLGLAVADTLARSMGGRLRLDGRGERPGTIARVTLPTDGTGARLAPR